jgi:PAS domain S-box-containing protein
LATLSQPRLKETLEHVKVPSAVIDRNGKVTWSNGAADDAFGELIGKPFTSVVAPEDVAVAEHQLQRKLNGLPATDYEVDVFTADGQRRRAEISSVRIPDGDACQAIFGVALLGRPRPAAAVVKLTERQRQVLQLLGEGASTADMAAALRLSKETVRNHVADVLRALGAHSRLEAVVMAQEQGLIGP